MEDRALSSDMLCRNSEGPDCGGGCYPTTATGQVLLTLAPPAGGSRCKEGMPCPGEHSEVGGACFCRPGTNLIEHYACRGTSLNGARKLSPVT
jgi:hypothetical protein